MGYRDDKRAMEAIRAQIEDLEAQYDVIVERVLKVEQKQRERKQAAFLRAHPEIPLKVGDYLYVDIPEAPDHVRDQMHDPKWGGKVVEIHNIFQLSEADRITVGFHWENGVGTGVEVHEAIKMREAYLERHES